jgi:thioredoxin-related protein
MKTKIILLTFSLLITALVIGQTAPESASQILDKAYKQAAAEKKNVLVVFHASWCGWCKKFEASINDSSCKAYFDKSFVIVFLTILESKDKKALENPGAEDIFNQNGGKGGGIPYFLFYNKKGKLLTDSKIPAGSDPNEKPANIGCPATEEEISSFVEKLKNTSKISEEEIAAITRRFKKNKS